MYTINKVKLATIVEGDSKAHFSIATTPRCRRGRYSIPWVAPLYPYFIMPGVKQAGMKYHFLVFGITRPRIERRSFGPLANTLLIWPIHRIVPKNALLSSFSYHSFLESTNLISKISKFNYTIAVFNLIRQFVPKIYGTISKKKKNTITK